MRDLLAPSPEIRAGIEALMARLAPGMTVALSTHINADGDGCGSEVALAHLLAQRGINVRIVNPTPWPSMFAFLLEGGIVDHSARGAEALNDIDALIVLDINDIRRLGGLADKVRSLTVPIGVIDHHVPGDIPICDMVVADTSACATGSAATSAGLSADSGAADGVAAMAAPILARTPRPLFQGQWQAHGSLQRGALQRDSVSTVLSRHLAQDLISYERYRKGMQTK